MSGRELVTTPQRTVLSTMQTTKEHDVDDFVPFGQPTLKQQMEGMLDTLASYGEHVSRLNRENRTDEALRAEYFYQGLLNRLCGLSLSNLNVPGQGEGSFSAGIDLCDAGAGLAYQITSQGSDRSAKIRDAVSKTVNKKRGGSAFQSVSRLIVFFVRDAAPPPKVPADAQELARSCGIEVVSQSLADIRSLCEMPEVQPRIPSVAEFVSLYFTARSGGGLYGREGHEALDIAQRIQRQAAPLTTANAYRLRAFRHFCDQQCFSAPWGAFAGMLRDRAPVEHLPWVAGESLREQDAILRYWAVDECYIQGLRKFVNDFPVHAGTGALHLAEAMPSLLTVEVDIYQTALLLNQEVHKAQMATSWSGLCEFGMESYASDGRTDPEYRALRFVRRRCPDSGSDLSDQAAALRPDAGAAIRFRMHQALAVDELIGRLDARIKDHGAMLEQSLRLARGNPPGLGMRGWQV